VLGLSPLPQSFPLVDLARSNPTFALAIGGTLLALLALAVTLAQQGRVGGGPSSLPDTFFP
jgi:hypothetical protein